MKDGDQLGGAWCNCLSPSRPLPGHVAIIPDGNRRWARRLGLPPSAGHLEGYRVAKRVLDDLWGLGVRYVTFYGLSRENCLHRPGEELSRLYEILSLAADDLASDHRVAAGRVRVYFTGDLNLLPGWLREKLEALNKSTEHHGPEVLAVAVCYSGRWEVVETARRLLEAGQAEGLDEEGFRRLMPLGWLPEPDLLIRTGGERRLSGFLLYHLAYTELYFTDVLWPDFSREELCRALCWFQRRERRFGR
ncbi:MAG: di-trans,poly-cis-decaprenylcistransferase [Crenarchaeota archaeon]|nr:di-trans,poly-cis-decaprenylcistransferase [Thermoproteota archaeon]